MPKVLPEERALTKVQAANLAGVHVRTVSRWVAAGDLTKYVRGANRLIVDKRELDRLLAKRTQIQAAPRT